MFKAHQEEDKKLQSRVKLAKTKAVSLFSTKEVEGVELIHYNNKICVPETLVTRVMEHYHEHLLIWQSAGTASAFHFSYDVDWASIHIPFNTIWIVVHC